MRSRPLVNSMWDKRCLQSTNGKSPIQEWCVGCSWQGGENIWNVCYADGYVEDYNSKRPRKLLLSIGKRDMIATQIDYILVSQRWLSCVQQSKACWGPSIHRNRFEPTDHALVKFIWKWRVRVRKSKPGPDWGALKKDLSSSEEVQQLMKANQRLHPATNLMKQ